MRANAISTMELRHVLSTINWQQPWLQHISQLGHAISQQIAQNTETNATWHSVLNQYATNLYNANNQTILFVDHRSLPKDIYYETFIYESGMIPTRPNLHDFFNALIWLVFPHTKALLNLLQTQMILAHGITATRQKSRDLITLFNENGLVLINQEPNTDTPPETGHQRGLTNILADANWSALFLAKRSQWYRHYHPFIFGHALLEKLVTPFKAITAHSFILPLPCESTSDLSFLSSTTRPHVVDHTLAQTLRAHIEQNQRFSPLPVMGIPGWCTENQEEIFYQDTRVFRPKRVAS